MTSCYNFICDLQKEKNDQVIKTRIIRKWQVINTKTYNNLISAHTILLDEHVRHPPPVPKLIIMFKISLSQI